MAAQQYPAKASIFSARILLLTTFSDDEYIVKALRIGTKGYLLKQDYAHITPAIRAVYDGQTVFGDEIVQRLPDLLQKKRPSISGNSTFQKKKSTSSGSSQTVSLIRKSPKRSASAKERYAIT